MQPRYEILHESFSTADAEYPQIVCELGCLRVTFRNWQRQPVTLVFHDVIAFSWDEGDAAIDESHRDDSCYLVDDSPWLERHIETGTVARVDKRQHFKLCYNAIGVLQVLASRMEVSSNPCSEKSNDPNSNASRH